MDKETTKVVFRKFKDGMIIALFPELVEGPGMIMSYEHVGQHGVASVLIVGDTKPASPSEYDALYKELEGLGYRLEVRRKLNVKY